MTFARRREHLRVARAVDEFARGLSITPITQTTLELGYGSEQRHDAAHAAPASGRRATPCSGAMHGTVAGRKARRAARRRMACRAPAACPSAFTRFLHPPSNL
ncbi:hypothetical protein WS62_28830 [Burkholderia sp. ABCPW 14]|nr:hypothetical protein WS62_28830 [Burkholderia sp. ABCPW 14]